MSIDFEKYLDNEQKTEIAKQAFYDAMKDYYSSDKERVVYLLSQEYVLHMVNDAIGQDHRPLVAEAVTKAIQDLSSYEVFRDEDKYNRKSVARQILNEAMWDSKEAIYNRLRQVIDTEGEIYFQSSIHDVISDYVHDNLFTKKDGK
jgi:hypothetical protein